MPKLNPFDLFESQETVAYLLLESTIKRIKITDYNAVKIFIIVPSKTSLKEQTISRYTESFKKQLKNVTNGQDIVRIEMSNKSGLENDLPNSVRNNPSTLHLIIHDECHWGRKIDSMSDSFYRSIMEAQKSHQQRNVFFLQISATAELFTRLKKFEGSVVNWMEAFKSKDLSKLMEGYVSIRNLDIVEDVEQEPADVVTSYEQALLWYREKQYFNSKTFEILYKVMMEKKLLVVRVKNNKIAKDLFDTFKKQISEEENTNDNHSIKNLTVLLDIGTGFQMINPFSQRFESYEEMGRGPTVLILCDKGDAGDTFPNDFIYDLRFKYQTSKNIGYYSTFKQTIGRACGFNKKAIVYAGPGIKEVCENDGENFRKVHALLQDEDIPSEEHPINREEVDNFINYFLDQIIVLEAEPQLGKTDSYFFFAYLLASLIYNPSKPKGEITKLQQVLTNVPKNNQRQFISDHWNDIHNLQEQEHDHPLKTILTWFSEKEGGSVLDLGCGRGILRKHLPPNFVVFGIDYAIPNENEFERRQDMLALPMEYPMKYDYLVYSLCLNEPDINKYIVHAHNLLNTNGLLFIGLPVNQIISLELFQDSMKVLGFSLMNQLRTGNYFSFQFCKIKRSEEYRNVQVLLAINNPPSLQLKNLENSIKTRLSSQFDILVDIPDGSCLFHCLAKPINSNAHDLRNILMRILLELFEKNLDTNIDELIQMKTYALTVENILHSIIGNSPCNTIKKYVEYMSKSTEYGTVTEILLFLLLVSQPQYSQLNISGVKIHVNEGYPQIFGDNTRNVIHLGHNGHTNQLAHFWLLIPKSG